MPLVIKGSSSGQVTVDVPAAAGTNTLTIPASTGELLTTVNPKPGNIIQVVTDFTQTTSAFTSSSTSYVTDSALPSLAITPSASDSKIYVSAYIGMQHDGNNQVENAIYRAISGGATTDLSGGNTYGNVFKGGTNPEWGYAGVQFIDSPNTTSAVTYTWMSRVETDNGSTAIFVHAGCSCSITLMEIAV